MAMTAGGLVKLIEECGELVQIAAKKLAYYDSEHHPDGKGAIVPRLEDEVADVLAAIHFCMETNNLDRDRIMLRSEEKIRLFFEMKLTPPF
jgi:NTP pyrophosphatase (non-canonical NTP hydrolase)